MTRPVAVLAALLVLGCRPRADEEHQSEPTRRAEVPGVETAPATTSRVRDVVRGFGTVMADAEPPEVRDARTALAEAEARRTLATQQVRRLEALAGGVAPRKELDAARADEAAAAAAAARTRAVLAAFGSDAARGPLAPGARAARTESCSSSRRRRRRTGRAWAHTARSW